MNASRQDDDKADFGRAFKYYEDERYPEAFQAYLALAKQGFPSCQTFVGWMYYCGEGTQQDTVKAISWLKKSSEKEDVESLFYLGKIYAGRGEVKTSIRYYQRAADRSYSPAMYKLGCLYERNPEIDHDPQIAYTLFKKASALGHLFAKKEYALKLIRGYEGIIGRLRGIVIYLKLLFDGIKIGTKDMHDERIRT